MDDPPDDSPRPFADALDRPLPANITGLVLAGGAGRRMDGRDKGLIRFRNQALASRALDKLRPQSAALLLSANRNLHAYRNFGVQIVTDRFPDFSGPLAGWHAGLSQARTSWLLSVPCDAPFFPDDLAARLCAGIASAPAAHVVSASGPQPVFALLHRRLLPELTAALDAGRLSAVRWLAEIGSAPVNFPDARSFANLNDLDALLAAEAGTSGAAPMPENDAATDA